MLLLFFLFFFGILRNMAQTSFYEEINHLNEQAFRLIGSNTDSALQLNLSLYKRMNNKVDPLTLSNLQSVTGSIYQEKGEYEKAIRYFMKSLVIREKLGLREKIAGMQLNLGNIYYHLGQLRKAIAYQRKSIDNFLAAGSDPLLMKDVYNSLGLFYDEGKEPDSALKYYLLALEMITDSSGNTGPEHTDLLCNLGAFHEYRWETAIALQYYQRAAAIMKESDDKRGLAWVLHHIGLIRQHEGKRKEAGENMLEARALAVEVGIPELEKEIVYSLLALAVQSGDTEKANEYLPQYRSLNDTLVSRKISSNIQEAEAKYELEKKRIALELSEEKAGRSVAERNQLLLALIGLGGVVVLLLIIFMLYRAHQRHKRKELEATLKDRELKITTALLEGQELEQKRIGRDLHDRLGGSLSLLKYEMEHLKQQEIADKEAYKKTLEKMIFQLDKAVGETRQISHSMVSGALVKFGLVAALKDIAASVANTGKLQLSVRVFGWRKQLDGRIELHLYRIVQELVSNMLKHANATHGGVRLEEKEGELLLEVWDNGIGFDLEKPRKGIGWENIRTRLKHLGGSLQLEAAKGKGVHVKIRVPAPDQVVTDEHNLM